MDFDFSEEQRLLRDSVDRLLADRYAFDKRRAYLVEPEGWSRALWSHYAEWHDDILAAKQREMNIKHWPCLQPQHGFADDVLHDLVGAAIDRGGAQHQVVARRLSGPGRPQLGLVRERGQFLRPVGHR